jgi:hypothetical protein
MTDTAPLEILAAAIDDPWDLDATMADSRLWSSPLGRFVAMLSGRGGQVPSMRWLALFVARRALPCWELYCDSSQPRDVVAIAEECVRDASHTPKLSPFLEPARPAFRGVPIVDCRQCDTMCAAGAVAHMARHLLTGAPRDLALCISSADMAFDQSPLGADSFRPWLIEVAVSAALEARELTPEERERFQSFSASGCARGA